MLSRVTGLLATVGGKHTVEPREVVQHASTFLLWIGVPLRRSVGEEVPRSQGEIDCFEEIGAWANTSSVYMSYVVATLWITRPCKKISHLI